MTVDTESIGQTKPKDDTASLSEETVIGCRTAEPHEILQKPTKLPLSHRLVKKEGTRRIILFFGLQLALFMSALDGTIISTSLPHIGTDFNQMSQVTWVSTAYLLSFDGFQPMFSKLSDIFGRKWILVFGVTVFLFSSILCGASPSMTVLIVGRCLQGLGAAGAFSMVFVVVSDITPLEKRANYQGLINAVFAVSSIFGPLIGGSLTDYVSWRWNFYINVPVGVVALALITFFLHTERSSEKFKEKLRRVDYLGTFNLLAFSTLFLLAMNFGGQAYPWKSAAVIVPLVLSAVLVGLLIIIEAKFAAEPLMPPRLFKNLSVCATLISNWFFGIAFFSLSFYLPIYLQVIRNDSATKSGVRLIPMQILTTIVSTAAGFIITKWGRYRLLIAIGNGLLTVSVGLISLLDISTSFGELYGFTSIGGIGLGCVFSAAMIALQAAVDTEDIAVVTGLGNFSRILGGAVGIAISAAVVNSSLQRDLPGRIPAQYVGIVLKAPNDIREKIPAVYHPTIISTYMHSLRLVWYVMIPMSAIACMCAFFIKNYPLKRFEEKAPDAQQDSHFLDPESIRHTHASNHSRRQSLATKASLEAIKISSEELSKPLDETALDEKA